MEVPRPLVDTVVATSSADIRWVEVSADDNQLEYPPSFIEWVDANCGSLTSEEQKTQLELMTRKEFKNEILSKTEEMLLKALSDKLTKHVNCRLALVRTRRDALVSP
jgi:hypothetical protein